MKTIILGGGISGLSAAWYLQKRDPQADILLMEKSDRLGGQVKTQREGGFQFEWGPRTLSLSRSEALLELIGDLKLGSELLLSLPAAERRYLWHREKLRPLRSFWPFAAAASLREFFCPAASQEDESIYSFASRRFGPKAAHLFFDPLTLGIYAGDIQKLSIRSCFPSLWEAERTHGSVVRSLFQPRKKKSKGLFTLRGGLGRLTQELKRQLSIDFLTNCWVESIEGNTVHTSQGSFRAAQIFSALPAYEVERLTGISLSIPYESIWVVHLGFDRPLLQKKGFGYLVPSQNKEPLLGMVWDSEIFSPSAPTQVTAMIRSSVAFPAEAVQIAADALRRHVRVWDAPALVSCRFAERAIPQMEVGHTERITQFQSKAALQFPALRLLGNYLSGPSLEACIQTSKHVIKNFT